MILFSIPVHEQVDVVEDQLRNFSHFVPNAKVVLHIARQWQVEQPELARRLVIPGKVWVNPTHLWSGHGDGIAIKMHVANFDFAEKIGIEFNKFCLHASNDMFVRHGLEKYVNSHDAGVSACNLVQDLPGWAHASSALRDPHLKRLRGGNPVLNSQVEGTFYQADLFREFSKAYHRQGWHEIKWPVRAALGESFLMTRLVRQLRRVGPVRRILNPFFYMKEEVYPSTFIVPKVRVRAEPYCYMNWENELRITLQEIDAIRSGVRLNDRYNEIFAVKRVERRINDPIRNYIRSLV